jgi:hypothetical protein
MKKNFIKSIMPLFSLFIFSHGNAQQQCWTSVGSAGTVDEADLNIVALSSNSTAVNSSTVSGIVDVRYNIVATAGLFGGECNTKFLTARYADNGSSAQVIIRLYTFNIKTGVSSTLVELNSNNYVQQTTAQAQTVSWAGSFNFSTNIYYLEVQLIKTGQSGNPLIRGLQICAAGICRAATETDDKIGDLNSEHGYLEQNMPNPFNKATTIKYGLPQEFTNAHIVVTNAYGQTLKQINISEKGRGTVNIDASTFPAGTYNYALIVDERIISSKQMVLTK